MDVTDKTTNADATEEQRAMTGTISVSSNSEGDVPKEITTPPPNPPQVSMILEPSDLIQFRLRRQAVDQASLSFAMIQEGYLLWAEEIRVRYRLNGKFDIDVNTGQIVERAAEEANNV